MVQLAAVLLRSVLAMFAGLLVAGGTLTLAADQAPVDQPTLVPAKQGTQLLTVPDVTGQAYVFAKSILQEHGLAWHVKGPVLGYAANTVLLQKPAAGAIVVDTGAPLVTLTLGRNPAYVEKGRPEGNAPYAGTRIRVPANVPKRPEGNVAPKLEAVRVPVTATKAPTATPLVQSTKPAPAGSVTEPAATSASAAQPASAPTTASKAANAAGQAAPAAKPATSTPAKSAAKPAASTPARSSGPRKPDFAVAGAPKEPSGSASLPDRVAALAAYVEKHAAPSATNLNHWLYEHAYVVAGARFGWWHGAEALQTLIQVDKRAEAVWGVGSQTRSTAEKALAEVRARGK